MYLQKASILRASNVYSGTNERFLSSRITGKGSLYHNEHKSPDQLGHPGLSVCLSLSLQNYVYARRKVWFKCANAQSDLGIRYSNMPCAFLFFSFFFPFFFTSWQYILYWTIILMENRLNIELWHIEVIILYKSGYKLTKQFKVPIVNHIKILNIMIWLK